MQDKTWQEFSQRMTYEGTMHVAVEPLDSLPDALALSGYNERNMHVLRTLASLDERRAENSADDDSPLMQELLHMDSKINVLMEIVNRLLIPVALLPARQAIRFNALGVVVPQAMLPSAGSLLVRLHFDACRALPLELPAQLSTRFDDGTAFVSFFESSEMVEDGLDRFVFRHHRRKVAEGRLTGG
ncbi:MAG: PilZ domain-containing protein [Rhodanobacter sp.]